MSATCRGGEAVRGPGTDRGWCSQGSVPDPGSASRLGQPSWGTRVSPRCGPSLLLTGSLEGPREHRDSRPAGAARRDVRTVSSCTPCSGLHPSPTPLPGPSHPCPGVGSWALGACVCPRRCAPAEPTPPWHSPPLPSPQTWPRHPMLVGTDTCLVRPPLLSFQSPPNSLPPSSSLLGSSQTPSHPPPSTPSPKVSSSAPPWPRPLWAMDALCPHLDTPVGLWAGLGTISSLPVPTGWLKAQHPHGAPSQQTAAYPILSGSGRCITPACACPSTRG